MAEGEPPPDRVKSLLSSFIFGNGAEKSNPNNPDEENEETVEGSAQTSHCGGSQSESKEHDSPSKPLNKDAFFQRLHTFTPLLWFAKPAWLSPLLCARYGWTNVDKDTLRCVSCHAYISGRLPATFDPQIRDEICEKLSASIKDGHQRCCPWPYHPTPVSVYAVPPLQRQVAADDFVERARSLLTFSLKLPLISQTVHEEANLTESSLQKLSHVTSSSGVYVSREDTWDLLSDMCHDDKYAVHIPSLLNDVCMLALMGWQAKGEGASKTQQIHCAVCQRVLGLWNFRNVESLADNTAQETDLIIGDPGAVFNIRSLDTRGITAESLGKSAHPLEQIMALDTLLKMSNPRGNGVQIGSGSGNQCVSNVQGMDIGEGTTDDPMQDQTGQKQLQQTENKPEICPDFLEAIMAVDTVLKMSHTDAEQQSKTIKTEQVDSSDEADSPEAGVAMVTNGVSHSKSDSAMTVSTGSKQTTEDELDNASTSPTKSSTSISDPAPVVKLEISGSPVKDGPDPSQGAGENRSGSKLLQIIGRLKQEQLEVDEAMRLKEEEEETSGETMDTQEKDAAESVEAVRDILSHLLDTICSSRCNSPDEASLESQSSDAAQSSTSTSPRSKAKKRRLDTPIEKKDFDPLKEHHTWCPWVASGIWPTENTEHHCHDNTAISSSNSQSGKWVPGWRKLLYVLLPEENPDVPKTDRGNTDPFQTPQRDGLRNIRSMLQQWT